MSTFSYLVLYTVVVSLCSVFAGDAEGPIHRDVTSIFKECGKEYGVTDVDLQAALKAQDVTIINPCYWGCSLKKIGFINDKGQYDMDTGLTNLKIMIPRDDAYAKLEDMVKQCESVKDKAVSDGEAGCERGALAAACFFEQVKAQEKSFMPINKEQ